MNDRPGEATHVDPVCGMTVDPAQAAGMSRVDGETVYFCSRGCNTKFDADPARYRSAPRGASSGGGGTSHSE